jgi:pyruvate/2-oxoglutarate dehydrogenase complex dihydrolipoamide acyltransferase (E2) component
MPKLGMTMEEGTIVEWRWRRGRVEGPDPARDRVREERAEIGPPRAVPATRHVSPGEVRLRVLLAVLTETADGPSTRLRTRRPRLQRSRGRPLRAGQARPGERTPRAGERRAIAPARALAKKLGLDAEQVPGSGPATASREKGVEASRARSARGGCARVRSRCCAKRAIRPAAANFGTDVSSFALLTPHRAALRRARREPARVGASQVRGDVPTLAAASPQCSTPRGAARARWSEPPAPRWRSSLS